MSISKRKWKTPKGEERETWVLRYVDQTKTRRLKTFATKKAAEDWATTALHEINRGIHTPASISKTMSQAWEGWINDCEANDLERSTIKQRREHLRLHVASFIGDAKLSDSDDAGALRVCRTIAFRRTLTGDATKGDYEFENGPGIRSIKGLGDPENVGRGVRLRVDTRSTENGPLRDGVDFPSRAELRTLMETPGGRWRPFFGHCGLHRDAGL
jgi:integrase